MALDLDILDRELRSMRDDLPVALTWQGTTASVALTPVTRGRRYDVLGVEYEADATAVLRTRDWVGGTPGPEQTVQIGSDRYIVVTALESQDGLHVEIGLRRAQGGRR
jgi:hypothetical protein